MPYNETNLLYFAAILFVFAVLVELWVRSRAIRESNHAIPLSDRMERAIHYFNENKSRKKITNDSYQQLTKVSDSTATRDLEKLEELGFLERKGKTSGTYYLFTSKTKRHTKIHKNKVYT